MEYLPEEITIKAKYSFWIAMIILISLFLFFSILTIIIPLYSTWNEIIRDINTAIVLSIIIGLIFIKIPEYFFLSRNIRLAEFLIKIKKLECAEEIIIECLKKNPNKPKFYNLYGRLLIEKREYNLAKKVLLEGLKISQKYQQIHYNLAILYFLMKNIEKAEVHNNYVLQKFSKEPKVLQQKILILFEKCRYNELISFFEEKIKSLKKNNIILEEVTSYALFSAANLNDIESYKRLLKTINLEDFNNKINSYHVLISSYLMEDKQTIHKILDYINNNNIYEYLTKEQMSNIKEIEDKINSDSLTKVIRG